MPFCRLFDPLPFSFSISNFSSTNNFFYARTFHIPGKQQRTLIPAFSALCVLLCIPFKINPSSCAPHCIPFRHTFIHSAYQIAFHSDAHSSLSASLAFQQPSSQPCIPAAFQPAFRQPSDISFQQHTGSIPFHL
jgi:hypothetical protein